jgi:hypothetical protein
VFVRRSKRGGRSRGAERGGDDEGCRYTEHPTSLSSPMPRGPRVTRSGPGHHERSPDAAERPEASIESVGRVAPLTHSCHPHRSDPVLTSAEVRPTPPGGWLHNSPNGGNGSLWGNLRLPRRSREPSPGLRALRRESAGPRIGRNRSDETGEPCGPQGSAAPRLVGISRRAPPVRLPVRHRRTGSPRRGHHRASSARRAA